MRERDQRAMADFLPGPKGSLAETTDGPLWLLAPKTQLALSEDNYLALEGFIAYPKDGPRALEDILDKNRQDRESDIRFDGHYALVHAELKKACLTLYRDPTAAERIFYVQVGDLLLFATSIKPLLAHSQVKRALNPDVSFEVLFGDLALFGNQTLWQGILEVLPGYRLKISKGLLDHRWHWGDLLGGKRGDIEDLSRQLLERLRSSVTAAVGKDGRVAVQLSGGIDSAAISAVAVELLGAENVHAFTSEYDDPSFHSEMPFAEQVCRHLKIEKHHRVRISRKEYLDCMPEVLWRSENMTEWTKADAIFLSMRAREKGFDKTLTGGGIGSHMAYLEDVSQMLSWLPRPDWTLRYWKWARLHPSPLWSLLDRLHPGLTPPAGSNSGRLYYLLCTIFRHEGCIEGIPGFFSPSLAPTVERIMLSDRVRASIEEVRDFPLAAKLQRVSFAHLNAQVDIARPERVCRELGALRISPAFFPTCLPFTYFPPEPKQPLSRRLRRLRPGKLLLREAMRGRLPENILYRKKDWTQTYAPLSWKLWQTSKMAEMTATSLQAAVDPPLLDSLQPWLSQRRVQLAHYALWHRMFIERAPSKTPPSWSDLGVSL